MKSPAQKLLARLQKMSPDRVIDAARRTEGLEGCVWESPAHLLLGLACLADDPDFARSLLTRHPHLLNTPCAPKAMIDVLGQYGDNGVFDGMTPLQAAASQGSFGVGQYLLSCPGINVGQWNGPIGRDERRNWTALFQSTWIASGLESLDRAAPFLRFAQMLLDHGADPFDPDADHCSPFSIALLSLSTIADQHEALEPFQVAVSLVEMCCPHLPELGKKPAHKYAIHDINDSLVRLMEDPMDSPGSVWFQSHSGLALPFGEAMMATLLNHGMAHPDVLALQTKFPAAFAFIEKNTLEERLKKEVNAGSAPSRRL